MTEDELQSWLTRRMKMPRVPSALGKYLRDYGYVGAALEGGSDERGDIEREARIHLRIGKEAGTGRRLPPGRPPVHERHISLTVEPREGERATALSEYHVKIAGGRRDVVTFRADILGGEVLAPEQARAWLNTAANAWLTKASFERIALPFIYDVRPADPDDLLAAVAALTGPVESVEPDPADPRSSIVTIDPPGLRLQLDCSVPEVADRQRDVWLPNELGGLSPVLYWPGSLIGSLHRLGHRLAGFFPWEDWQGAWFILTGEVPEVSPITVRSDLRAGSRWSGDRLTLDVSAWMPVDVVMRAYTEAQAELRNGRDKRAPNVRNVALFQFVTQRVRIRECNDGRLLSELPGTWRGLARAWNELHPEWQYNDAQLDNFRRDYLRGRDALLSPEYRM